MSIQVEQLPHAQKNEWDATLIRTMRKLREELKDIDLPESAVSMALRRIEDNAMRLSSDNPITHMYIPSYTADMLFADRPECFVCYEWAILTSDQCKELASTYTTAELVRLIATTDALLNKDRRIDNPIRDLDTIVQMCDMVNSLPPEMRELSIAPFMPTD